MNDLAPDHLPSFEVSLPILPIRFELESTGPLFLEELMGAVRMRGALGLTLRRLVCPTGWWERECRTCELWRSCPYPGFFEPAPPPDAERLRLNQDIPRPYVFRSGAVDGTFDLTLIGKGSSVLPYLVASLRQLGNEGFGRTRRRFTLARVTTREVTPRELFDRRSGRLDVASASPVTARERRPLTSGVRRYHYLTPTILKAEGAIETIPSYATLVKRARDRIHALSVFFGDGVLPWDFKAMGSRAEAVRTASWRGGTQQLHRFSSRTRQVQDLSGFTGQVVYEGPEEILASLDPLLHLISEVHVGKGAAMGNGQVGPDPAGPAIQ